LRYPAQVGFAVSSRSFPRATDRNRIKRLGREAWRLQKQVLYDFLAENKYGLHIFFIYTGREIIPYQAVYDKFSLILKKILKDLETSPVKG
jgi:ribonuclease P protein component